MTYFRINPTIGISIDMGTCDLMVRVSVSRPMGRGFEPRPGQHVMSLGKAFNQL